MKKILEKIKDIMYDSFDYVVMLAIVVVVISIIGWRLDILFTKDAASGSGSGVVAVEGVHNEDDDKPGDDVDSPEPIETPEAPVTSPEVQPVVPPVIVTGAKVKVIIPAGSLPGKIGSILADSGVISSSRDFIAKAVELKLDTKLKSGTFNITQGSTNEEIVRIISK